MRGPTSNGHMTHFGCRPRIFNTTPSLCLKTNVVQGLRVLLVWIKCSFHSELFPLKSDWMHFIPLFFNHLSLKLVLKHTWCRPVFAPFLMIQVMDRCIISNWSTSLSFQLGPTERMRSYCGHVMGLFFSGPLC